MTKTKQILWSILNKLKMGGAIQLRINSSLLHDGWFRTFETKTAVDKNGNPIPWWTYSFIDFITPRLKNDFDVFEYGCGNSTIWLAERVKSIKSVENNNGWFKLISQKLPANAEVVYRQLENGYTKEVTQSRKKYHIIIIDGRERVESAKNSIEYLQENGVIIFDNSDRGQYTEALQLLKENNFKRLDFYGIGPVTPIKTCTSIFYKKNNCLEI